MRKARYIERLEARNLLTAAAQDAAASDSLLLEPCHCPVCQGMLPLESVENPAYVSGGGPEAAPLSSLPQLSSNPTATAKLFLDFDGHFESSWSFRTNATTPAFSQDGNTSDFTAAELSAIQEIWARVAEDYAPFNIDVTTIDPGHQTDRVVAVIAIGGSYSDWYGSAAGGVAFVGGFSNFSPNVGYVFANSLGNSAKNVAEAASHEAGHLFGLSHQARWTGTSLTESYHSGSGTWAPIMGNSYGPARSTWHNGTTSASSTTYQDDLAIIAGATNGFGYKTDDYGSTIGTASNLAVNGTSVNFTGLIGRTDDQDVWSFTTTGGSVSFTLTGATYGTNLDAVLELADSSGTIISSNAPTGSFGASLSLTVGAGTYYLIARGSGTYGDMGQYTITGTLPSAASAPAASVSVSGSALNNGGTLAFGTTTVGAAVNRTVTITNSGNAVLNLTSLNAGAMPAGFTLVQNLGATSLNPAASTTFVLRLDAAVAGSYSGQVSLTTNDAAANPFTFQVTGNVTAPSIAASVSGSAVTSGGTVSFGSTTAGTSVNRTITITNSGNATLTLTSLNAGSMPAGFTLVQNLQSTSLAPGASTTFVVRLDAATAGSYSGQISLASNAPGQSPFNFQLTGTVTAVQLPSINFSVGGSGLAAGGTVNFGSTTVGTVVSRTITVTNSGTATLTLTSLSGGSLPAGYSLVQNLGSTSLAPGASTTFVLRLDAAAAGTFAGQVSVVSNVPGQSPFNFQLTGTVTAVQLPSINFSVGGSGLAAGGTVNFGSTTTGTAVTRTITVTNSGTATLTLTSLSGGSLPGGYSLVQNLGSTSLAPGASTTFVLRLNATAAGSFSGQVSVVSNDATKSPFNFQVSGTVTSPPVTVPEIRVTVDGVPLTPGSTLDFGSCQTGGEIIKTVTVTNNGTGTLTLTPLSGVTLPAGFTLVQDFQSTSLAVGASTTFVIRFCATGSGSYGGQVCLTSNDPVNGLLTFQVAGEIAPAAYQGISDDGNAGNRLVGSWKMASGKGYGNDIRTANKGNGSVFSTWNFTQLPAGQYQIWATWTAGAKNATNAPFTISNGNKLLKTVRVSQRIAPSGAAVDGVNWKWLGTVTISGGNLLIKLTNNANGSVVADAIRVQQIVTSPADLATTHFAGAGVVNNASTATALFSSRSAVHLDALPLPGMLATQLSPQHGGELPFSHLLELLSTPQAGKAESVVDQVFSGDTNWSGLTPLLV